MARKINTRTTKKKNDLTRPPAALNQERQRTRRGDPETFLTGAEKHDIDPAEETRKLDPETRARLRSRGDKINIYVVRGTPQQRELLKYAAVKKDVSVQKLLFSALIRELEEEYGADLPLNNL